MESGTPCGSRLSLKSQSGQETPQSLSSFLLGHRLVPYFILPFAHTGHLFSGGYAGTLVISGEQKWVGHGRKLAVKRDPIVAFGDHDSMEPGG